MIFDKYPYTNFHEMNDDWVIQTLREFGQLLDEFVAANSLTYADPIEYDPDAIYAANTVVIYGNAAYVSKHATPAGMLPTNVAYWLLIFPFGDLIDQSVNVGMQEVVNMLPTVVNTWMTNHPDITTTVQDGAIDWLKLHNDLKHVLLSGYSESSTINIDDFEQGAINIENGADAESTFMCRTGFITFPKGITLIRTMQDLRIQVFQYALDGTFEYRVITVARIAYMPFVTDEEHKYRISISYDDYSRLTPADLPLIPVVCSIYQSEYAEAADAVMKSAIAAEYSSERTYDVNDYVFHSGALYRCVTAITTAEEWTAAHWTQTVLCSDVERFKNKFDLDEQVFDMGYVESGSAYTTDSSYNALISVRNQTMSATTNTNWVTRKYPVIGGHMYKLIGRNARVNYDQYALAAFSELDFDGTDSINCVPVVGGNGATETDYDVDFVAPSNGYIYITQYADYATLTLYDGVYGSARLYNLTNTKLQTLKIQAFGDSITDDSWRRNKTTWLTLLPDYLTQRQLDIKNEAVGGSHIGHGHVNSQTGKYHELEYNYVYDLMTNEEIFDPTSDIIIMFVGTNDFNSSPLGAWGDSTVDTFYGAARLICEFISQHTDAIFFVVTPIARPYDVDTEKQLNADGERVNTYGATLRDYADALIRTCEFYQFPVIDLFHDLGLNKTNVKAYLDDVGVHPSIKGSNLISAYISSCLKKHIGI